MNWGGPFFLEGAPVDPRSIRHHLVPGVPRGHPSLRTTSRKSATSHCPWPVAPVAVPSPQDHAAVGRGGLTDPVGLAGHAALLAHSAPATSFAFGPSRRDPTVP